MTKLNHSITGTRSTPQSKKAIASIAGALFCVAASSSAFAGERYSLAFSPDNMASPRAMEQLHNKVRAIASKACPAYSETRSFALLIACRKDVESELIAKINVPAFTAFAEQAGERSSPDFVAAIDAR